MWPHRLPRHHQRSHQSDQTRHVYEYQTVAACDFVYENMGAFPAYYAIAAWGTGLIWHYNANQPTMEQGTVLLIDYAPELELPHHRYHPDLPVGDKFSDAQTEILQLHQDARNAIIAAMNPRNGR